ncbi:hypothetical protein ACGF8B_10465 [Streptomyces sp. NPDC047917]|uniref:hypothetical protein n=1 Tax=Streptomyces sp. NPDC047917 TaxID=3365491 RepID=UPI003710DFD2
MRTVYSGELRVAYGQFYVESRPDGEAESVGLPGSFAGQVGGLCGAAVPGHLFLITSLHTGEVGLTVEVHDTAPPLDDSWEDVVEAAFRPASGSTVVMPWADGPLVSLDLPVTDHRVRYCGRDMDRAREEELAILSGEAAADQYLLQFWPAAPRPDEIVKRTAGAAEYWHQWARALPPPPSPEERAEARRLRAEEQARAEEAEQRRLEALEWGGRLPSQALRDVGGNVAGLRALDCDLLHAVDAAGPAAQRSIARWAAHRAYTEAGLNGVEWIAPALEAMDRGHELPAPFDELRHGWDRFFADPAIPHTLVDSIDGIRGGFLKQAMAMPALFDAMEPVPLRAALDALYAAAATYGSDHPRLFDEVRRRFRLP